MTTTSIFNKNFYAIRECRVNYGLQSDDRQFRISYNGQRVFTSLPISFGNSKLDKCIGIFDIPAVITCPNHETCAYEYRTKRNGTIVKVAKCYALKAQTQYAETYNKRMMNLYMSIFYRDTLFELIYEQIRKSSKKFFRIHSSGDFYNLAYAKRWSELASLFPDRQFYAYTKTKYASVFDNNDNFNVVASILPDGELNFGNQEYINRLMDKYPHLRQCPYGRNNLKVPVHCGKNCFICFKHKQVCFLEH